MNIQGSSTFVYLFTSDKNSLPEQENKIALMCKDPFQEQYSTYDIR